MTPRCQARVLMCRRTSRSVLKDETSTSRAVPKTSMVSQQYHSSLICFGCNRPRADHPKKQRPRARNIRGSHPNHQRRSLTSVNCEQLEGSPVVPQQAEICSRKSGNARHTRPWPVQSRRLRQWQLRREHIQEWRWYQDDKRPEARTDASPCVGYSRTRTVSTA